ncbi:MAG: DUF3052 domain-containing protein [Gemmatimonadetes bacterium]|nr:DUF3052 domain-containing protein [Gemmatimonadota bacterium]
MTRPPAGYSGTPLARKLGIEEGHRLAVLGAPAHFRALLDLPADTRLDADPPADAEPYDVVVAFAPDREALHERFPRGHALLDPHGGLWIAWPKQSSPLATGMRESDVRSTGLAAGLVDNKICAVDGDWSGLRFVVRVEDRPARRP